MSKTGKSTETENNRVLTEAQGEGETGERSLERVSLRGDEMF